MARRKDKYFRLSLKVKLGFLITLLIVISILSVGNFLLEKAKTSLTDEITKRGLTIARNLAASAKNSLAANDDLTLNLLVRDALRDEDVAYVIFADQDGKIIAHGDLNFVGRHLERPKELQPLANELLVQTYKEARGGTVIDFAVPLEFSKVRLGALYLGFSDRSIRQTIAQARDQMVWITALMIIGGIAGAVGLAVVLTRPIQQLVRGTKAIAEGSFDVSVPVTSRDEIGDLTVSFNQMAKSLREKEMIKHAFSRYVAREVVDEILKDPGHLVLRGERRDVTVLFCDMRGFTPLAERLPPEEVVAALNEFYSLMIDTTFKHDGTLDKFLGDAVMAVFGAPVPHPDHCIRAVRTALAMQLGIAELSMKRMLQGKDPIAIGIGISAGDAVAGTVGTENRMEYTVIGDKVNLAARLEANAKGGQILISRMTYDKVVDLVQVAPLGVMKVKGKEEEVEVFEVLGLVEAGESHEKRLA